jgi:hypothetical protein
MFMADSFVADKFIDDRFIDDRFVGRQVCDRRILFPALSNHPVLQLSSVVNHPALYCHPSIHPEAYIVTRRKH